jgi:hypothetical protein
LKEILANENIGNANTFKIFLFSKTYHNFDNDAFNLAYSNTDKIVRQVENKSRFESLLENKNFSNNINLISIQSD